MIDLKQYEVWFVTGSQHLYGPQTLEKVAEHSREIAAALGASQHIPVSVVFKPVVTTPDAIREVCLEANSAPNCIGLIAWMHTFSPAKMWIGGLTALSKPLAHLHTQYNREIPWAEIDMDFMNLNQAAHGDDRTRARRLFGTARPLQVDWTFEAVNLTTGAQVPVREEAGESPRAVHVVTRRPGGFQPSLVVTFPEEPAGAVFELTATARMRDPFGIEGEMTHRVWSHALTHRDPRVLARSPAETAALLAGVAPGELGRASDLGEPTVDGINDDPRVPNPRATRATMVQLLALAASEDRRVTVDELRGLISTARTFDAT